MQLHCVGKLFYLFLSFFFLYLILTLTHHLSSHITKKIQLSLSHDRIKNADARQQVKCEKPLEMALETRPLVSSPLHNRQGSSETSASQLWPTSLKSVSTVPKFIYWVEAQSTSEQTPPSPKTQTPPPPPHGLPGLMVLTGFRNLRRPGAARLVQNFFQKSLQAVATLYSIAHDMLKQIKDSTQLWWPKSLNGGPRSVTQ